MIPRSQQSRSRIIVLILVFLLMFISGGCYQNSDTSSAPGPDQQTQDGSDNQQQNTDNDTPNATGPDDQQTQENHQPKAVISAPQASISGQTVTLDGGSSSDPDLDKLSYQWIQTKGPSIVLSNSSSASFTFIAPSVQQTTQFVFKLTVNDGELSNSATVSVQISPIADSTGPSIVSRSPQANQSGVSTSVQISAGFDEALLEASIDSQSFLVSHNGNPVPGAVSYDSANNTITNKPSSPLTPGTTYTVTLANAIKDFAGNAFSGESWSFSTATETIADGKCATAEEGNSLMLSCPSGQVIKEVVFASYGNPGGVCGSFTTGSCNASSSEAVVSDACKGENSCTLVAGGDSFGNPCEGTVKKLSAQVACGIAETDCDSSSANCSSELDAVAFSEQMGVGWNAGNSLDAVGGETAWGNPLLTQELFESVKAAGFDTLRLPVAWSVFSDPANFTIESSWMARVEQVVDYALNADLYVIINIHWDGGWMQPTYAKQEYVNNRLATMWEQIANNFSDYDNRLLFAGTNEVMVDGDYGTPTKEYYTVQNSFNKTFVDTVRATGGNNADRYLIVQGFNTNIDHTVNFAVLPTDTVADRLMMEVHFYDPYNFTLNTDSGITQWGSIATDSNAVEDWANESWMDSQFQKMKSNFVDNGVPVILGEFGVVSRLSISGHERYRVHWNKYMSQSAVDHGLVPVYWDNGFSGDGGMAIFDRKTGDQLYPDIINAIVGAAK